MPGTPSVAVVSRRPLLYRRGADPALDRPAHVRAASGLTAWGDRLVVVQDDALFLGLLDPETGLVDDVPLPVGAGGRRVFGKALGNKADKPDFEVVFALGERLVVLGSGGPYPARRAGVSWFAGGEPVVVDLARWCEALTARHLVPGTALNLEGGEVYGGRLVLAQRGGDRGAPDVLIGVDPEAFARLLDDPAHAPLPETEAHPVSLGAIGSAALHFTDLAPGHHFSAAAEDTDSFFDDGAVAGSVVGALTAARDGVAWSAVVRDGDRVAVDKIEGLVPRPGGFWAVTDPDDPDRPGELLALASGVS